LRGYDKAAGEEDPPEAVSGMPRARDAGGGNFDEELGYLYLAFISYGQDRKGDVLTAAVQRILNQYARQSRRRPLPAPRVFRDTTDLAVGGDPLKQEIYGALDESKYLIVVASEHTAGSTYVPLEVKYWLDKHGREDRLLFVLLNEGPLEKQLPAEVWKLIAGREETLRVQLTEFSAETPEPVLQPVIRRRIAQLAARLLGVSAKDLIDEDIRQERRSRRWRKAAIAGLAALTVLAVAAAALAMFQRRDALNQRQVALQQRNVAISVGLSAQAQQLAAGQPNLAKQLALAAYQTSPTDAAEGALLESATLPGDISFPAGTRVISVSASPDGRLLAAGIARPVNDGNSKAVNVSGTELWDLRAHRVVGSIPSTGNINAPAFTPSGHILAVTGSDNLVQLWSVANPRAPVLVAGFPPDGPLSFAAPTVLAMSPDGRTLVVADPNHRDLWFWNIADPSHPVQEETPREPTAVAGNNGYGSLVFGPDGKILIAGAADGTVHLWNVANPRHLSELAVLSIGSNSVFAMAISPDGRTLAAALGDGSLVLWNVTDPRHPGTAVIGAVQRGPALGLAFSPDGNVLAATGAYGSVARWTVTGPGRIAPLDTVVDPGTIGTSLAYSPDGDTLYGGNQDGTVGTWGVPSLRGQGNVPVAGVEALTYSPDGRTLAGADVDHTTWLWNAGDPRHLVAESRLSADTDSVLTAAFAPVGHTLATGSADGIVHLWDTTDPSHPRLASTLATRPGRVSAVAFSRDGRILVAAGWDSAIRLWDVTDPGRPVRIAVVKSTVNLNALAISPDGRALAGGSVNGLFLWDIADLRAPTVLWNLPETGDGTGSVAFSPDGRRLASGDLNGTILLWNVADPSHPRQLARLSQPGMHSVASVAFSPDGRMLISGDSGFLRLWDVAVPAQAQPIGSIATGSTLDPVAVSPFGTYAAAGAAGGHVVVVAVSPGRAAADVCAGVGDPITRDQWNQYISGLAYARPCPDPGGTP
jgi:WD40 repeat protein